MSYRIEPGLRPRARLAPRFGGGVNAKENHAFFITDIEQFVLTAWFKAARGGHMDLASRLLRIGLDWEHFEALMPDNRAEITGENAAELQRLADETEFLVAEVDIRTGAIDYAGNPFPPVLPPQGSDR